MGGKSTAATLIKMGCLVAVAVIIGYALVVNPPAGNRPVSDYAGLPKVFDPLFVRLMPEEVARLPIATRFDYPMGDEHAALTYNARPFREVGHLGDDFNGIGGTDSDLGDPIYAVGAGEVVFVGTPSPGWGTVVIVGHRVPVELGYESEAEGGESGETAETAEGRQSPHASVSSSAFGRFRVIQSFYAHLADIRVFVGQVVQRGDRLGSVGPTAKGSNWPHLHFELRESRVIAPGVGYADSAMDRLNPEEFFAKHRGAPDELLNAAPREGRMTPEVLMKTED